jgi:acetoin utilization deacetylase AcuC-like enzyme
MKRCGLLHDPVFLDHQTGVGHPECPERTKLAMEAIRAHDLLDKVESLKPTLCTSQSLKLVHSQSYLTRAEEDIKKGSAQLSTGDTMVCEDSWKVAQMATGGIIGAVDQIMTGSLERAFCLTRPPGHHATPTKGMGFCLFNHVAVAARHAQSEHDLGRVLIVDWDVHHGNGTQDIFYEDESVYFFSTHQSPWYPGTGSREETGTGKGLGYTKNHPLPAQSGHSEIVENAFADDLVHRMNRFKPELIIISAGFDSRKDDPLGDFLLEDAHFAELTKIIRFLADEYAEGRVLSVLEGGYNLKGLASACVSHLQAMID